MFKVLYALLVGAVVLLCIQGSGVAEVTEAEIATVTATQEATLDAQTDPVAHVVTIEAEPVEVKVLAETATDTPNATDTTTNTDTAIVDAGQNLIDAYKTGGWLALLAALVTTLTALLRKPWMGGFLERIPKRARILVPLILGCIAALLTAAAGGISWGEAAVLAFLTGPTAVAMHQGIARSLFGIDSPSTKAAKAGQ